MNIFKKSVSKDKKQEPQNVKPSANQKQEEQKSDPHADGGCCGSCGGQQGKGL